MKNSFPFVKLNASSFKLRVVILSMIGDVAKFKYFSFGFSIEATRLVMLS